MENVGGVDVLEAAEDLVNKGLEVGICKWLAGTNNSRQVALHQLYMEQLAMRPYIESTCPASVGDYLARFASVVLTLVEVRLVEVVWSRYVHVIETCDLVGSVGVSFR